MAALALAMAIVASVSIAGAARADVYTWRDAAGMLHSSNLPPPDGATVLHRTHEDPAVSARAQAAARDAESIRREAEHAAQVKQLTERVADLERAATERKAAPVVVASPPMVAPAPVVVSVVPPMPEDVAPLPMWNCAWTGCGFPFVVTAIPAPELRVPSRAHRRNRHPVPPQDRTLNPAGPTPRPLTPFRG
jgi:hypothetical protein